VPAANYRFCQIDGNRQHRPDEKKRQRVRYEQRVLQTTSWESFLFICTTAQRVKHAPAESSLLPYLAGHSVQKCVSACCVSRNGVPACCACLYPAEADLLIFQTALWKIRIDNKFEFAGSISEQ
jgi:hypothetical protein